MAISQLALLPPSVAARTPATFHFCLNKDEDIIRWSSLLLGINVCIKRRERHDKDIITRWNFSPLLVQTEMPPCETRVNILQIFLSQPRFILNWHYNSWKCHIFSQKVVFSLLKSQRILLLPLPVMLASEQPRQLQSRSRLLDARSIIKLRLLQQQQQKYFRRPSY